MIRPNNSTVLTAGLLAAMSVSMVSVAEAQGGLGDYYKQAEEAIKLKQWDSALKILDKSIKVYEPRIQQLGLDDQFGCFYYQKGVCLAGLKQYEQAIEAYNASYTKFPSAKNPYAKVCLYRMADCYRLMGNFDKASEMLEKFLKESRGDKASARINQADVQTLLAMCCFKSSKPNFEKGVQNFLPCLTSRVRYRAIGRRVNDVGVVNTFFALVDCGLKLGKINEINRFITEHGSAINVEPTRVAQYSPNLLAYVKTCADKANEAKKAGDIAKMAQYNGLALQLMGLFVDEATATAEIERATHRLGDGKLAKIADMRQNLDKSSLDKIAKQYKDLAAENNSMDAHIYSFIGAQALGVGSNRLTRATYQILMDKNPQSAQREDYLYLLAMMAWQLDEKDKGSELIDQHMKEFPKSKYAPVLSTLSLEGLLKSKQYELCVSQCDKVMELHKNEPNHSYYILALFCKGASLVNLRDFQPAIECLDKFVNTYKDSSYLRQAMYLLGEAYNALRKNDQAIAAFTNYIARYPDKADSNMPSVLLSRAYNYVQRDAKGDEELAIADAQAVVDNYKEHRLYPYANNLLGSIYGKIKGKEAETKQYYMQALESAKALKDKKPAAEAAISLLVDAKNASLPADESKQAEAKKARYDEVKKWYDTYWAECDEPGSRTSLECAAVAFDFFKDDAAMFDVAKKKMEEVIVREGKKDDPRMTTTLEEAVNTYTKCYLDGHKALGRKLTDDEKRRHFYRFPGVDPDKDKSLVAMLRMSIISRSQEEYDKAPVGTEQERAEKAIMKGLVDTLFAEVKRDFKPSELPPYTLVKLGMHLANTSRPEEGIPYFDEILEPSETDPVRRQARLNALSKYRKNAIFGKAVALGNSKDNAKIDKAIEMMRAEISTGKPDAKTLEDATYNLVRFTVARGNWKDAIEAANLYRSDKRRVKDLKEVLYLQAKAYRENGEVDKALVNYMNLTGTNNMGTVKWSGPAMLDYMDTLWERNKPSAGRGKQPSDRYIAWKAGNQYVSLLDTDHNRKRMTAQDSDLLNQVKDKTAKFGADGAVAQERADIAAWEAAIRASKGQK